MKAKHNWEMESVLLLESKRKNRTAPTVEELTSLSADSVQRHYPHLICRPSPGRVGMKMKDALAIANGTAT